MSLYKLPVESRLDMLRLLNNEQLFAAQQTGKLLFELIKRYKNEMAIAELDNLFISTEELFKEQNLQYIAPDWKKELNLGEDVKSKFGQNVYEFKISDARREKWEKAISAGIPLFADDFRRDLTPFHFYHEETSAYLLFISKTEKDDQQHFLEMPPKPLSMADMFFAHFWFKQLMDCLILYAGNLGYPALFNVEMLHVLFDDEEDDDNFPICFHIKAGEVTLKRSQDVDFVREHLCIYQELDIVHLFYEEGLFNMLAMAGQRIANVHLCNRDSKIHNLLCIHAEMTKNCMDIVPSVNFIVSFDNDEQRDSGFLRTKAKVIERGSIDEPIFGVTKIPFVKYEFANKQNPSVYFQVYHEDSVGGGDSLEFRRCLKS